jgi:hypothetical protein
LHWIEIKESAAILAIPKGIGMAAAAHKSFVFAEPLCLVFEWLNLLRAHKPNRAEHL